MRTVQVDRNESRFWPRHTHGTRSLSVLNTDYLQNVANWDTFYWMELDIPFKQIELASRYEDNSRGQGWYSVLSKLLTRRVCKISLSFRFRISLSDMTNCKSAFGKVCRIKNRQTFKSMPILNSAYFTAWYAELRIGILLKVCRFVIRHITTWYGMPN